MLRANMLKIISMIKIKPLIRRLPFFLLFVFFVSSPAYSQDKSYQAIIKKLSDQYFSALVGKNFPGAVVGVVVGGDIVHLAGYGFADIDRRIKMDPNLTITRLGSSSEFLTAIVSLSAAENSLLNFHKDVRPTLIESGIDINSSAKITVHQLLTHTSGLGDRLLGQNVRDVDNIGSSDSFFAKSMPPILLPPGTAIIPSSLAFSLTGLVLEHSSGRSFAQLSNDLVFNQLGMTRTTFDPLLIHEWKKDLANSHILKKDSFSQVDLGHSMVSPSSGAVSTAFDMSQLLSSLFKDDAGAIDSDAIKVLTSRQASNFREMHGRSYGFYESIVSGYSAWTNRANESSFTTHVALYPELNFGVFVAVNAGDVSPFSHLSSIGLAIEDFERQIIKSIWPEAIRSNPDLILLSPDDRADYAASYRDSGLDQDTPIKVLGLLKQIFVSSVSDVRIGFDNQIYRKIALDVFQSEVNSSNFIRFLRNDSGLVTHLLLPNRTYERVGAWESIQVQVIVLGLAFGFLLLGNIIVLMGLVLGWWGRLPNLIGFISASGGLGLAFWLIFQVYNLAAKQNLEYGIPGMPYPSLLWATMILFAVLSFGFSLFGRGINGLNRWGLIFVAVGWAVYYPFLSTWYLI